jgi:hypothetical protein
MRPIQRYKEPMAHLYRAVDKLGRTVDFLLSNTVRQVSEQCCRAGSMPHKTLRVMQEESKFKAQCSAHPHGTVMSVFLRFDNPYSANPNTR